MTTTIPPSPTKHLHLLRHAHSQHNIRYKNHALHDPLLTPKGLSQCTNLQQQQTTLPNIDLIIISPLRRAIYTAIHSFPSLLARNIPVIALPELQETNAGMKPCDTGSDRDVLEEEFGAWGIDFGLLCEGWNRSSATAAAVEGSAGSSSASSDSPSSSSLSNSPEKLKERAAFVRRWLYEREEREIVVVSHGGFLHYLVDDWEGFDSKRGTGWGNCEVRSFVFREGGEGLVEVEESRKKRMDDAGE